MDGIISILLLVLQLLSRSQLGTSSVLPTTVSINPAIADINTMVTFTCDFELVEYNGKVQDLGLLLWKRKFGGNVYRYNHLHNKTVITSEYSHKIISAEYIINADPRNINKRSHVLKVKTDSCDTATFVCEVYNQEYHFRGQDEKQLQIIALLPRPYMCWNNQCHPDKDYVYVTHHQPGIVKCRVTDASVYPYLTLRETVGSLHYHIYDTKQQVNPKHNCLFDGEIRRTKPIENTESSTEDNFTCTVDYGVSQFNVVITIDHMKNLSSESFCYRTNLSDEPQETIKLQHTSRTENFYLGKSAIWLICIAMLLLLTTTALAVTVFILSKRKRLNNSNSTSNEDLMLAVEEREVTPPGPQEQ